MRKKYKIINNEQEAKTWLINNFEKFIKQNQANYLKEKTLGHALYLYTGSMSQIYNDILYQVNGKLGDIKLNHFVNDDTFSNIKLISNAFRNNQINENLVLYHYTKIVIKEFKKNLKKNNNTFCPNKFLSTSLLKKCPDLLKLIKERKYNVLFKIYINSGLNCIPILWDNSQSKLSEYEIILESNLKLKFLKLKRKIFSRVKYEIQFCI